MIKTFLILINLANFLYASQQIVLVVSDDVNNSNAKLECYEDSKKIFPTVNVKLGKNGLGWGIGEINLTTQDFQPLKYEGDKKAPMGVFKLTSVFGYANKMNIKMPYIYTNKNLICVDDSDSEVYNQIVYKRGDEKSFEYMRRKDHQYELGIVVQHNQKALHSRGSCIFMHVKKTQNSSTAGCTAMSLGEIKKIVLWLDKKKNPILIQIAKSSAQEVLRIYPMLKDSKLLGR